MDDKFEKEMKIREKRREAEIQEEIKLRQLEKARK